MAGILFALAIAVAIPALYSSSTKPTAQSLPSDSTEPQNSRTPLEVPRMPTESKSQEGLQIERASQSVHNEFSAVTHSRETNRGAIYPLRIVESGPYRSLPTELISSVDRYQVRAEFRPTGCKDAYWRLKEWSEETRIDFWADRMEIELREFWSSRFNVGHPIAVGCRATICQVSVMVDDDRGFPLGPRYRYRVIADFQNTPMAVEFSRLEARSVSSSSRPGIKLVYYLLVSKGNELRGENSRCSNIGTPG